MTLNVFRLLIERGLGEGGVYGGENQALSRGMMTRPARRDHQLTE